MEGIDSGRDYSTPSRPSVGVPTRLDALRPPRDPVTEGGRVVLWSRVPSFTVRVLVYHSISTTRISLSVPCPHGPQKVRRYDRKVTPRVVFAEDRLCLWSTSVSSFGVTQIPQSYRRGRSFPYVRLSSTSSPPTLTSSVIFIPLPVFRLGTRLENLVLCFWFGSFMFSL